MSTILVVGNGGREHAIVWKLCQSPKINRIIVAPGNGGILSTVTRNGVVVIPSNVSKKSEIVELAKKEKVRWVLVGPEAPLADGLADELSSAGILCFGPSREAALIEASKAFSKEFMVRHKIPTARHQTFTNSVEAIAHVESIQYRIVVKASGLAAGKGVIIPQNKEEAKEAIIKMIDTHFFGEAGNTVVIEEFLEGEESSFLVFTDGTHFVPMPPAQDHKRIRDGDQGLNTGGMGAFAPTPSVDVATVGEVINTIVAPAVSGMREEGHPFVGVLYAGVILTKDGPKCLEYNCRFGDPETQVLLPLLKTDLVDVIDACCTGNLGTTKVEFHNDLVAATVVAASAGYPENYQTGFEISGLEHTTALDHTMVFHAGTAIEGEKIVTSGGRVLAVTATGGTLGEAIGRAYVGIKKINFSGMQYRNDIGARKLKKVKLGILGSTRGTDMQAIIDAISNNSINSEICMVISNVENAYILERAKLHNIPHKYVPSKDRKREEFDRDVVSIFSSVGDVDLVLLIGFMRIISPYFISQYENRILNVHPSLLPEFAGGMDLNVHEQVLKARKKISGCTVHFVTEKVDQGGILIQRSCSIDDNETPETLKEKVQALEGEALVECIRMYQQDRLRAINKSKI